MATCTNSSFSWSFNSLHQDPCQITTRLGGVCTNGLFTVNPLQAGFVYQGPTLDQANQCRCSTVFYSLVSACAACQNGDWLRWSIYSSNCSTVYSTIFPEPLPPATPVPHYAYNDVTVQDTFNLTEAQFNSPGPESSSIPSPTSSSISTSSSAPASGKKSHAGAIAGGVIGGVVFVALVSGLVIWLLRRRRNNVAPSQAYSGVSTNQPMAFNTGNTYVAPSTPKLYDPSDPSTFPSSFSSSPPNNSQHAFINPSLTGSTLPNTINPHTRYTGAPEV